MDFIQWASTNASGALLSVLIVIGLLLFVGAALRFWRS